MIKVGTLVECLRTWPQRGDDYKKPIGGRVYTVRDVTELDGIIGIRLEEIVNEELQFVDLFGEPAFAITNFEEVPSPESILIEDIIKPLE